MDPATRALVNSIVILIMGSGLTFAATWYWLTRASRVKEAEKIAEATAEMTKRVNELESQMNMMKQAVVPISTAFQAILIKELTHFHTPRMDYLMEKIGPPTTLTHEEQTELAELLAQRSQDMGDEISDLERDAAKMLPMVMKRSKAEADAIEKESELRMVAVPMKPVVVADDPAPSKQVE